MEPHNEKHPQPVWGDRADFVIRVALEDAPQGEAYEHLWARWLSAYDFEICCIPFMTYGLALGDRVRTDSNATYERLVEASGRRCVRLWREDTSLPSGEVERLLVAEGLLYEWRSPRLVAIDLPTTGHFGRLLEGVAPWRSGGRVITEDGN